MPYTLVTAPVLGSVAGLEDPAAVDRSIRMVKVGVWLPHGVSGSAVSGGPIHFSVRGPFEEVVCGRPLGPSAQE